MTKRFLSSLFIALIVVIALSVSAFAADIVDSGYCGGEGDGTNLSWNLDSDGLLTISGTGEMKDYTTIYEPDNSPWISDSVTSVVIENGVTSIGEFAFMYCSALTNIVIPDTVTSIERCAFFGCSSLTSIHIPASVTSIGFNALYTGGGGMGGFAPNSLTSITVDPNNPVYLGIGNCLIEKATKTLLYGCTNSIIPTDGSVTSIGDSAFSSCNSLTSIEIPDSVTSIGEDAFIWCTSLTSVTISDSVTNIGESAFRSCPALTDVYYSGTKKEWGKITIESGNDDLLNATIHFAEEDDDEYLLYYEQLMALQNMRFTITATASEGGTVSPAGRTAYKHGSSKTYTFTPDEGYEIASVIIDGKDIGPVDEYTFKNIKGKHTVSVVFAKSEWANPFTDVSTADWFYNDVRFVNEQGLMIGTASDKFSPNDTLDRATVVTTLWRLAGSPEAETDIVFDDLGNDWYTDAMKWAIANEIILGYGDGTCKPLAEVTREELSAIFKRFAEYAGIEADPAESTISQYTYSSWAENDVQWAESIGLFEEIGIDITDLTETATRAEVAAYLKRLCALINP